MELLPLDDDQFEDLAALRDLGPERLRALREALESQPPAPMRTSSLIETIAAGLDGDESAARSVVQNAMLFLGWVRHGGLSLEAVYEGLGRSVEQSSAWSEEEVARWREVEQCIQSLIRLPIIRLSVAANDLSFDHANLFQRARILTEIRPIFDENAEGIEGAVICHSLRLRFQTINGPQELTIALEEVDVESIAEQCDRALRKSRIAHDLIGERANVPSIISGAMSDA